MENQSNTRKDTPDYRDRKIRRQTTIVLGSAGLLLVAGILAFTLRNNAATGKKVKEKTSSTEFAGDKNTDGITSANITVVKKWEMPKELKEISGISYLDDQRMVCVQDESGKVYIYNIENHKVEKEIGFGDAGDYEGIAMVGKTAWVLRADGVLYEVNDITASKPSVQQYSTHLTADQNCEGLCYDKQRDRLLVTIKDSDPASDDYKGIYSFDLKTRKMAKEPAFKIDLQHKAFATTSTGKKGKKEKVIKPSGIAIDPTNQDLYITDGPKSRLLLTDSTGSIKKLMQLDTKLFAQPEGIAFNNEGALFISNEGEPGNILKVAFDD